MATAARAEWPSDARSPRWKPPWWKLWPAAWRQACAADPSAGGLGRGRRFEQFFSPELSRHLTAQPDLLAGRQAEVSLLFCDVRGFSRLAEELGPAVSLELMGEILNALSDCVIAHQGVLVDYIGDEMFAMWVVWRINRGTPSWHARPAGHVAATGAIERQMAGAVRQALASRNRHEHRSRAVGNTGSNRKFKYGPLGTAVNLASRGQGATKYLRTDLLVTEFTHKKLDCAARVRRIGKVRVQNIAAPVDLYELPIGDPAGWDKLKSDYELALADFEAQRFRQAAANPQPVDLRISG